MFDLYDEYVRLTQATALLRLRMAAFPSQTAAARLARAELADELLKLAVLIADVAAEAPGLLPEEDPLPRSEEAVALLEELLATTHEGTGEQRWLNKLAADVVEFAGMLFEDPEVGNQVIDLLEHAYDPGPAPPKSDSDDGGGAIW